MWVLFFSGRTTWKDLQAETHLNHQEEKKEKALVCAEFHNPSNQRFSLMGKKVVLIRFYGVNLSLQTDKAFPPYRGRIVKLLADFR